MNISSVKNKKRTFSIVVIVLIVLIVLLCGVLVIQNLVYMSSYFTAQSSKEDLHNDGKEELCTLDNLDFKVIEENDEVIIKEAVVSRECLYNYNLVTHYDSDLFDTGYSFTRKYAFDTAREATVVTEEQITTGNITFSQETNDGGILKVISNENILFQRNIYSMTCSPRDQVSYIVLPDSFYFTYYSSVSSQDPKKEPSVEYGFYKVEGGQIVNMLEKTGYVSAQALYVINDSPVYVFEKENKVYGINYNGRELLTGRYVYIENSCCCDGVIWGVSGNNRDSMSFFAYRGSELVKVEVISKL